MFLHTHQQFLMEIIVEMRNFAVTKVSSLMQRKTISFPFQLNRRTLLLSSFNITIIQPNNSSSSVSSNSDNLNPTVTMTASRQIQEHKKINTTIDHHHLSDSRPSLGNNLTSDYLTHSCKFSKNKKSKGIGHHVHPPYI